MKIKSIIYLILVVIIAVGAFFIGGKFGGKPTQTASVNVVTNEMGTDSDGMDDEHEFLQADYNFDGYPDRLKMLDCGATGNCSYEVELYDPIKKVYTPMTIGEEIFTLTNPMVNKEEKLVCSYSNIGAGSYYLGMYKQATSSKGFMQAKEFYGDSDKLHGCTLK